jgi:hypothetical protein
MTTEETQTKETTEVTVVVEVGVSSVGSVEIPGGLTASVELQCDWGEEPIRAICRVVHRQLGEIAPPKRVDLRVTGVSPQSTMEDKTHALLAVWLSEFACEHADAISSLQASAMNAISVAILAGRGAEDE